MPAGERGEPAGLGERGVQVRAHRLKLSAQPRNLSLEDSSTTGAALPPCRLPLRTRQGHIPSLRPVT